MKYISGVPKVVEEKKKDEGVISDYESEPEMSEEMVLEKLEKFLL